MAQYITYKIKVFKQLGISIADKQIEHMQDLKSEIAIDNYCRSIILNSLQTA